MAKHVFLFPDVGEGIHEAQFVEWLADLNGDLKEDAPLCRVETDKAVVDLPSPVNGKLVQQHATPGELIFVGNPLATFEVEGAGNVDEAPAAEAAPAPAQTAETQAAPSSPPNLRVVGSEPAKALRPQDVPATPHTRAFARKLGVDITTVAGTGRNGRVTNEDVERASQQPAAPAVAATAAAPAVATAAAPAPVAPAAPAAAPYQHTAEGPVERVPMSFLRRKISEQMRLSFQKLVHVTHIEEADVTELFKVYKTTKALLAEKDVKLSTLPYFIKAIVAGLKEFPIFNSSYDEATGEIIYKKYYNIGMAVDTPEGLVVPVLKDADRKDIYTLAQEIRDKAKRGRTRELKLDELKGGTFTISNIGSIGGVMATPIINYPELAIIALHKIQDQPAVVDGEICIRKKMYMSISFDHQIIDGADAARFMRMIADLLSNPHYLFTRI